MGKRGKWFAVVKKVFSPEPKEKKIDEQKSERLKAVVQFSASTSEPVNTPSGPPSLPMVEAGLVETVHDESVVIHPLKTSNYLKTVHDGAECAAPQAAEEVAIPQTTMLRFNGKSHEEAAAIMIQTTFRGHQARRAVRASKGLVRLQSLVDGDPAKRHATATLRCMQTLSRVQSQIQTRRIRLTEEKLALHRQRREQELEALKASMGDEWDDSLQTKEQIDASLMSRHEAAIRRERTMAYAFSHQRKNSLKSGYPLFTDLNNPHWEWSCLERLTAATKSEKEQSNDHTLAKTDSFGGGDITNAYAQRDVSPDANSPAVIQKTNRSAGHLQAHAIPPHKQTPLAKFVKSGPCHKSAQIILPEDDESRSIPSIAPEGNRRHSVPGSMLRDNESVISSSTTPNFMTPTKSAMAKSRLFHSPSSENVDPTFTSSAKKQLSSSSTADKRKVSSPARRHSGPPKVNNVSSARIVRSDHHAVAEIVEGV